MFTTIHLILGFIVCLITAIVAAIFGWWCFHSMDRPAPPKNNETK